MRNYRKLYESSTKDIGQQFMDVQAALRQIRRKVKGTDVDEDLEMLGLAIDDIRRYVSDWSTDVQAKVNELLGAVLSM